MPIGVNTRALLGILFLVGVMAVLLFGGAGTIRYPQAWAFIAIYFASALLITFYLMKNDPALLERRLHSGPAAEKEPTQKIIMTLASILFVATLVVPALDHRFGWSAVPLFAVVAGDVLAAVSFYAVFLVFAANPFTSATVEIADDQRLITTGPYAIVRHPMYAGALLLLLATPFALGSYAGLLPFLAMIPILIWRLMDEERILGTHLAGYREYCAKVRWRLLPGIF
jgi:protein-S-isoprenylcysteine O-methyltransferase Ste14